MLRISASGSFKRTSSFLTGLQRGDLYRNLNRYGQMGVDALARATPRETGLTASSWDYRIENKRGRVTISWFNTNTVGNVNVAILLQYGHGTGTGGYVQGYDYINPAIRPIFDAIANDVWNQVTKL